MRLITLSNTAVNAFVYAGRHRDFREVFGRFLRRCICRNNFAVGIESSDTEGEVVGMSP